MIFLDGDPGPEIRRKLNEMVNTWQSAVLNAAGWSIVLSVVSDGERRVLRVVDGIGENPNILGYIGSTGLVADIALAVDIRGPIGLAGPPNTLAIGTVSAGENSSATITGESPNQTLNLTLQKGDKGDTGDPGWTPILAVIDDSTRRVQQVVDWIGGQGTKPATGQYVGATGLVADIALAVDIRGPAGTGTGNVSSTGTITANSVAVFADTTGNIIKSAGAALGTAAFFNTEQLPISAATQSALDTKASIANPTFTGTVSGITKGMVGLGSVPDVDATNASNLSSGTIPKDRLPDRLKELSVVITDWNTATSNGWYSANGALNSPGPGWYLGYVEAYNDGWWCTQTLHEFTTDSASDTKVYRRDKNNGVWSYWYRLRLSEAEQTALYATKAELATKQDALVSGTNIKTINGQSILGSGNITIRSGVGVTLSGDATIYINQSKTYVITNYNVFSSYTVQVSAGIGFITGDTISFTAPATAQTVTMTVAMDGVATEFSLVIAQIGVSTPTNIAPPNGATNQNNLVTLTSSAFAWIGVSDTHLNSDWQLAIDSEFVNVVQSTGADATNKTTWTVSGLSPNQTYYWRVRHRGTNNGVSSWSTGTMFTTKAKFNGLIGTQGGQGFGVGEYSGTLPPGFSAMVGTSDIASDNYGNYQYSDGSVMVFVPRFYYRIGNFLSPRYATYGYNAIDIVGIDTYATEAEANAAGYAMHRAFKDGGADKSGFFIDKYLASQNGTTSCKSVQNGVPISLTFQSRMYYTNSNGMTTSEGTCTGIAADAVLLARSRGIGTFNVASVFMYSALALLSLAHAQASSNTTYCAWYDATNNFPKGCNGSNLADVDDASVTYTSAGDVDATKPKTGSGSPFAKTTHNGQSCGVADLNGVMGQVMLGITNAGTSDADTAQKTDGNAYVLKTSVALSSLTYGWNGTNDAWGDTTNLATKYDLETGLFPWGGAADWTYFGNGSNQVFSGATSGISWNRTACGIQNDTNGTSETGTSQFGNDGCYQYNCANLFAASADTWVDAASAGVFYRIWSYVRTEDFSHLGFRAGAYGS